ncbi:MAG: flagellar export chaperone FliS [Spirochaetales bacterium]|jgi:flagellar protein FliS|nr:flagellar export chaperone FliS [Spirochaetales bacterium]
MYVNPSSAYKEARIKTAGQGQLIVMLYEEALKQIDTALQALEDRQKKLDAIHNALTKAQDVITELTVSLDFDKGGEVAKNLFTLYMFFNRQLMEGNVQKDPKPVRIVRNFMAQIRDSWVQIANTQVQSVPSVSGVNIAG